MTREESGTYHMTKDRTMVNSNIDIDLKGMVIREFLGGRQGKWPCNKWPQERV